MERDTAGGQPTTDRRTANRTGAAASQKLNAAGPGHEQRKKQREGGGTKETEPMYSAHELVDQTAPTSVLYLHLRSNDASLGDDLLTTNMWRD